MACTARWTPRWFNKPKFHILLHLPEHIRRFGPAPLFATEAFESYNSLIRSRSIHSNRHAPSLDIAKAFGHSNRIRHLLSGGKYLLGDFIPLKDLEEESEVKTHGVLPTIPYEPDALLWTSVGPSASNLMIDPLLRHYLGRAEKDAHICELPMLLYSKEISHVF